MKTSTVMRLQKQCGVAGKWTITARGKRGLRSTINDPDFAYVRTSVGPIHRTKEIVKGRVFADFDKKGNLVGVEIL